MIVNGVISDGNSVEVIMSLQEFKDLYLLLDVLTNGDAQDYNIEAAAYMIAKVQNSLSKEGMGYHNDQEVFSLLHAASIIMRPLADNITTYTKAMQKQVMQGPANAPVQ